VHVQATDHGPIRRKVRQTQLVRRAFPVMAFVVSALGAAAAALTTGKAASDHRASAQSTGMPIVVRCPQADDLREPGTGTATTADQIIAVARRINHREVTHYQGRAERRTRWNTPVHGLVMNLSDHSLYVPGRRALAARAKKRCGKLGGATSAVTFYDSLSTVCCQTFTLFVVKGRRAWIVFKA
jgi:hypothetical protein